MFDRVLNTLSGSLTLYMVGLFRTADGLMGGKKEPLSKICHTYPTSMKLNIYLYLT